MTFLFGLALVLGLGDLILSFVPKPGATVKYELITITITITIAVVFSVMGERAEGVVRPAGDWLFGHWPVIVGPMTAVIGLAVLVFGIVELSST